MSTSSEKTRVLYSSHRTVLNVRDRCLSRRSSRIELRRPARIAHRCSTPKVCHAKADTGAGRRYLTGRHQSCLHFRRLVVEVIRRPNETEFSVTSKGVKTRLLYVAPISHEIGYVLLRCLVGLS